MKVMKGTTLFVATLGLVCIMGSFSIFKLYGQQIPPEEIAVQPPPPESIVSVSNKPSVPRIRYRDVINQLSDSIVGLKNEVSNATQRLEAVIRERDSLKNQLHEAKKGAIQPESQKSKRDPSGKGATGVSSISLLLLGVSIIVLVATFLLSRVVKSGVKRYEIKYKELQHEFENYRRTSRERFEKQAIDHFNELKRLKKI